MLHIKDILFSYKEGVEVILKREYSKDYSFKGLWPSEMEVHIYLRNIESKEDFYKLMVPKLKQFQQK